MTLRSETAPTSGDQVPPAAPEPRRTRIGRVVAGSLAAGFVAAVILPFLPVGTVDVDFSTAMVLFGLALGWALLAVLSTRFTDQPQRWAVVPAIFMAVAGALVLLAPDTVVDALGWVWPPALVVLVVWVWIRARRELHSRARVWLLNPVLVILVLLALGGGYETISQSTAPAVAMRGQLVDVGPYRLHLECTGSRRSDRDPRARWRRLRCVDGVDRARCGPRQPSVRLRPGGAWLERPCCESARWRADRHRSPHAAGPRTRSGSVCAGRALVRRTLREDVRREVSRRGRRSRPGRLHRRPQHPRVRAEGGFLQRPEARVLVGRDDVPAGPWLVLANTDFSTLPPKYRDDARATAATGKEMGGFLDEFGVANRSEAEAGTLRSLDAKPLVVLTAEPRELPGMDG